MLPFERIRASKLSTVINATFGASRRPLPQEHRRALCATGVFRIIATGAPLVAPLVSTKMPKASPKNTKT